MNLLDLEVPELSARLITATDPLEIAMIKSVIKRKERARLHARTESFISNRPTAEDLGFNNRRPPSLGGKKPR